ncbi:glycoside hydrolase family 3 C-terminal domain-containing protein [Rhodohalobacter sp. 614A]|uniref:glycoside hydrolase family 3 C-terminal domain-containing protein n=1 Tax=Rhodohalobacter sp. 614A TaxID=2908649 RepID=UPI001F318D97|nr:glycoside hydrolase family 3 C-terminal domain-containing protein [Rhodohalobacter sp. 614A]
MDSSTKHPKEKKNIEIESKKSTSAGWSRREFLRGSLGSAGLLALSGTGLFHVLQGCTPEDSKTAFARRASELIEQMTVEEKISQLRYDAPAIDRLNIPQYNWWNECLHGVGRAGLATVFPQAIGMAATWNTDLFHETATVISDEARAKHKAFVDLGRRDIYMGLTFWTPNINIVRDPRWGRGQETYGEDPYLTGQLANSFIRGIQGDDPNYYKAIATSKHFAVHNGPEPLRHSFDVDVSDRDLYETYLPMFKTTVQDAKVASVMCAYNRFRGLPCCGSDPLLKEILRDDWGFEGYVVTDCWAIADFYVEGRHDFSDTAAEAAAISLKSGSDVNCGNSFPHLQEAYDKGMITDEDLNVALQRLFEARFKLGMFDDPADVPFSDIPYSVVASEEHNEVALQMARESIVLLKNEAVSGQNDPLLPLDKNLNSIAVIGPNADNYWSMLGNYHGTPADAITPLKGIQNKLGDQVQVNYALGSHIAEGIPNLSTVASEYLIPSQGEGNGLYGEYFDNSEFEGEPVISRVDPEVDFIWKDDTPINGELAHQFSGRWTGQLRAPVSGTYAIGLNGMNYFKLYFEGEERFDRQMTHSPWYRYFEIDLEEGETYDIMIEFYSYGPDPQIQLTWEIPGKDLLAEAIEAVENSDVAVLCLGLNARMEGEEMDLEVEGFEGGDKTNLKLPAPQGNLMKEIYALGKPVVLVLMSGSAIAINWADENIPSILQAWYGGQAGGTAVADVLFGDYNPAGRLPVTFYKSIEDLPEFTNYDMEGHTYKYFKGEVLYPFGYGLSYTTFDYANLQVGSAEYSAENGGELLITADVTNSGELDGDEVVQLYLSYPNGSDPRLVKELKAFKRVRIPAGGTQTVEFSLNSVSFEHWNEEAGGMAVLPGDVELMIGRSSGDIQLSETFSVTA